MYCSKDAPNFYFVLISEGCAGTTAGIGCFALSLLASVHGFVAATFLSLSVLLTAIYLSCHHLPLHQEELQEEQSSIS